MRKALASLVALVFCAMTFSTALGEGVSYMRTDISDGDMIVGRALAPQGYAVQNNMLYFDGATMSMTCPVQLIVDVLSPDGSIEMAYTSGLDYIHILEQSVGGVAYGVHQDGVLDQTTMCMMFTEMTAGEYADAMMYRVVPEAVCQSETPVSAEVRAALDLQCRKSCNAFSSMMTDMGAGTSLEINDVRASTAERFYSMALNGIPYRGVVSTLVSAVEMTMTASMLYGGNMVNRMTSWSVPYCYLCIAPEAAFDAAYADFRVFVANTAESDQFVQARATLANQIRESILSGRSESYAQMFAGDLDSDNSYNEDRFTDYIMDQNDYRLSSGEHVKIPTEYAYVYEDGHGGVYATDSALDAPAGMTQLTPSY